MNGNLLFPAAGAVAACIFFIFWYSVTCRDRGASTERMANIYGKICCQDGSNAGDYSDKESRAWIFFRRQRK